jgi:hypothetical protein
LSISWHLDVDPAPALLVLPPAADSLDEAHAAIELWEHYSRKRLDPTQRLVVEVLMAETADGRWAAATTGREMPRQNGKGDEIEVVELWGLVQRGEAILHTVHDAVLLASQTQQRMLAVLEHPDLRVKVKRKWLGTGQQMIEMRNGGVVWYRTRTGGGGRGVDDIDRLVVDEAQHAVEEQLAAVTPTLLANSNPQMNVLGTAAIAGKSAWWWSVRKRALQADPGSFGYVGHTAEKVSLDESGRVVQEPVNVKDRKVWAVANPVLKSGRGSGLEFLEEQLFRLGSESFAREHLGVWDPDLGDGRVGDINLTQWAALEHQEHDRPSPVAFAITVNRESRWSTITLAGRRSDGLAHLQVVQSGKGTSWVADRMAELEGQWGPVAVALDPGSPAGSLTQPLKDAGVDPLLITGRDVTQACGAMFDAIAESAVRHSNQPVLNIAVRAAGCQPTGKAWVWRSVEPDTDIEPLNGVSLALHALTTAKKPRSGAVW